MRSRQWQFASVVVVALALVRTTDACTIVSIPIKVGPEFTVHVADRGRAIAGMMVELERYEPEGDEESMDSTTLVTNNEGRVTFLDLSPGQYFVSVQRAGISSSELIEVEKAATEEGRTLVELDWPGRKVLRSQTMSGRFWGWLANTTESRMFNIAYPVRGPLKEASLTLARATTGETIWHGVTDGLGRFFAPGVTAGLYILQIRESELYEPKSFLQINDAIPVEISDDAAQAEMDVELAMSSCGLSYTSACPVVELVAPRVCGTVMDSEGGAIDRAEILFYGVGETSRNKAQSGADGSFDLGVIPAGEYRLSVGHVGFSSANVGLTLTGSSQGAACEKRLAIVLRVAGQCSTAAVAQTY